MTAATRPHPVEPAQLLDRFARVRARTRQLFALLDDRVYYERPIPLRNPVVFYEGHLPAFAVNTLVKRALGQGGVDEYLETIFARGIDPEAEALAAARGNPSWPSPNVVHEYADAADRLIVKAIQDIDVTRHGSSSAGGAAAVLTILEHEEMHQETLAYIWHQVPYPCKRKPAEYVTLANQTPRAISRQMIRIPPGIATLGTDLGDYPFAWDNELPPQKVMVEPFQIDAHNVTNADFMRFVDAGGYRDRRWWSTDDWAWVETEGVRHPPFWQEDAERWYWRGMFERVALPPDWPVYVTWAEANAYASWRDSRLPTEAEFHRAAFGAPDGTEQRVAWRQNVNGALPANVDFVRWDPVNVGSYRDGVSAYGVYDLVGNGWEWTRTPFAPFAGFTPTPLYPEYSADFFDDAHYVMKGGSPVTARELLRPGFRNWFRPRYPYVYATFRCVSPS